MRDEYPDENDRQKRIEAREEAARLRKEKHDAWSEEHFAKQKLRARAVEQGREFADLADGQPTSETRKIMRALGLWFNRHHHETLDDLS